MTTTLYYYPMSSSSGIHWALEELGIPYQAIKVDLRAGEQKNPAYLALNPNGKVPTLIDQGATIFESLAILIHLGQHYGVSKNLWPQMEHPLHKRALSLSTWGAVTLGGNLFQYFHNVSDRFPKEQHNAAQANAALKEFEHHLEILDRDFLPHSYVLGEDFSLVDSSLSSMVAFAKRAQLPMDKHPRVNAWLERCLERPARQKALSAP